MRQTQFAVLTVGAPDIDTSLINPSAPADLQRLRSSKLDIGEVL